MFGIRPLLQVPRDKAGLGNSNIQKLTRTFTLKEQAIKKPLWCYMKLHHSTNYAPFRKAPINASIYNAINTLQKVKQAGF